MVECFYLVTSSLPESPFTMLFTHALHCTALQQQPQSAQQTTSSCFNAATLSHHTSIWRENDEVAGNGILLRVKNNTRTFTGTAARALNR